MDIHKSKLFNRDRQSKFILAQRVFSQFMQEVLYLKGNAFNPLNYWFIARLCAAKEPGSGEPLFLREGLLAASGVSCSLGG